MAPGSAGTTVTISTLPTAKDGIYSFFYTWDDAPADAAASHAPDAPEDGFGSSFTVTIVGSQPPPPPPECYIAPSTPAAVTTEIQGDTHLQDVGRLLHRKGILPTWSVGTDAPPGNNATTTVAWGNNAANPSIQWNPLVVQAATDPNTNPIPYVAKQIVFHEEDHVRLEAKVNGVRPLPTPLDFIDPHNPNADPNLAPAYSKTASATLTDSNGHATTYTWDLTWQTYIDASGNRIFGNSNDPTDDGHRGWDAYQHLLIHNDLVSVEGSDTTSALAQALMGSNQHLSAQDAFAARATFRSRGATIVTGPNPAITAAELAQPGCDPPAGAVAADASIGTSAATPPQPGLLPTDFPNVWVTPEHWNWYLATPPTSAGATTVGSVSVFTPTVQVNSGVMQFSVQIADASSVDPVTLGFGSSLHVKFLVSQNGNVVWDSSAGQRYLQSINSITINPGAPLTFTGSWSGFTAASTYSVQAVLLAGPVTSPAVSVTAP